MKKIYTLTISLLLILNLATAQVPQGFKYQTAIRDNNGAVIANKLVAIKLSLLTGSANGTAVYSEVHKVATNDFGVANLNVGNGTVSLGSFSTIDWGSNTYFMKTEVDINNGTNFTFMGSSQLLSVPFAMYAAKSANAADDKDKDSTNELQAISLTNNNLQLNKNGGSVDLTKYTIDNNTDSQTISLTGNTLAITRGNFVKINDIDSTNELQQITLNNNNLQLNKNGGSVDLTKYDKDSQQLVLNGNILSITKGNSIVLSSAVDLDADPTNEIQNITLSKDTLKLSKANYVVLPKDNDADSTNEIQSLSVNQNKLSISKSNQVNIDADTTNELQSISFLNDSLRISKNVNSAIIPSYQTVQSSKLLYGIASGINNINLTLPNAITAYSAGMIVNFKAVANNTSAVMININGLGNKAVLKNISIVLDSNDIRVGQMVSIIYDGINFQFLVSPYANTAKSAYKLNNDSTSGLVPKGTMIISNKSDPIKGFSLEEEIRSSSYIEKLAYSLTCPSAVYGDSIYYTDKIFSLRTNLFSNKKNTTFNNKNSVMIEGKIYYVTYTGNMSTSINNIVSYDPVLDTVINKTAFLPAPGTTSVIDLQVLQQNNAIYILRTTNNTSINQTVGKIYKYNFILDTVTLINTQTFSSNGCQLQMIQSQNEIYIIATGPPNLTINAFFRLRNDTITSLSNPYVSCSGCKPEFYCSDDYVFFGTYYYNPLSNIWTNFGGFIGDFICVLNNKSYFVSNNYDIYEIDISKNSSFPSNKIITSSETLNNGIFGKNKDKIFFCGNSNSIICLSISKKRYLFKKD